MIPRNPPAPTCGRRSSSAQIADGIRIAYAAVGNGPPPMKTGHCLPIWSSTGVWSGPYFLHKMASEHRLIRYDKRGSGLSDRDIENFSLDAFVSDLESVVEAAGPTRFPLLGMSQAARFCRLRDPPPRAGDTSGALRGICTRRPQARRPTSHRAGGCVANADAAWVGSRESGFPANFTTRFVPDGTPDQAVQWFNDLQRMTTSPENAVRIRSAVDEIDISALLPQVRVPTLVPHCRDDAAVPFEEGRRMAAGIPGAHFVALEGRNHVILKDDPGWQRLFDEIREFIRS